MEKATPLLAQRYAQLLREADRAEIEAAFGPGLSVEFILQQGLDSSIECWSMSFGGELACFWGVSVLRENIHGKPVDYDPHREVACGWLLTTHAVTRHPKTFWICCAAIFPPSHAGSPVGSQDGVSRGTLGAAWGIGSAISPLQDHQGGLAMCAPAVIVGAIGAVASIAGTVASGVAQADAAGQAAEAAAQEAENRAAADLERAQVKEKQRLDALIRGGEAAAAYETLGRRVEGQVKTQAAASGLEGAGFAGQARYLAGLDARRARADAVSAAWGFDVEKKGLKRAAKGYRDRAAAERRAGFMGQTAIAIGTAGSVASQTAGAVGSGYKGLKRAGYFQ
jgi:hypothetical protein